MTFSVLLREGQTNFVHKKGVKNVKKFIKYTFLTHQCLVARMTSNYFLRFTLRTFIVGRCVTTCQIQRRKDEAHDLHAAAMAAFAGVSLELEPIIFQRRVLKSINFMKIW